MNASAEQIEFVRRNGIVHCPPSPIFQMYWGARRRRHNFAETTEADVIRQLAAGDFHIPVALRNRDWKNKERDGLHR